MSGGFGRTVPDPKEGIEAFKEWALSLNEKHDAKRREVSEYVRDRYRTIYGEGSVK